MVIGLLEGLVAENQESINPPVVRLQQFDVFRMEIFAVFLRILEHLRPELGHSGMVVGRILLVLLILLILLILLVHFLLLLVGHRCFRWLHHFDWLSIFIWLQVDFF